VFGSLDVMRKLFERTPLEKIFKEIVSAHPALEFPFVDVAFSMILSRFVRPCSKLKLKENWLDRFYPEFISQDIALQHLYRCLDYLEAHKEEIQKKLLYPTSQYSLFEAPKLELVFYDTTTLRFESIRNEEGSLRRFGYSKEKRNDCTQVILGLLLDRQGLPVGYRLFPGNTYEGKTLPLILKQLKNEYRIERLIFVADRGMTQGGNLTELAEAGFEFIVGMKLWTMKAKKQAQITALSSWDFESPEYKVKELPHLEGRLIVTWSRDREKRDQQVRKDLLEKLKSKLDRKDDPTSLISHKGFKRYLKTTQKGKVTINERAIAQEAQRDGLFGILTNVPKEKLSAQDILTRYKELWNIEDAFGEIKGTLETRPMFHWTDKRIEGHMMICFLAYYLEAYVTQQLRKQKADFTAPTAFEALNQVRAIPVQVRNQTVWVRTKIEGTAAKTYQHLKIRIPGEILKLPYASKPDDMNFQPTPDLRAVSAT
jgi:transposase